MREPDDDPVMEPPSGDVGNNFPFEVSGQQDHEMPTGTRDLRPELPE